MNKVRNKFIAAGGFGIAFLILLVLVMKVDVRAVGPEESKVGFATINNWFHKATGVHMLWYDITDYLGKVALVVAGLFGLIGLVQMIRRKSLLKVDPDILALGVFYIVVIGAYVFFEIFIINYRPIIMKNKLEASFPSSHTMLTVCIMSTTMIQIYRRFIRSNLRTILQVIAGAIMVVTVIGRLICGVHWLTDILAGLLLGLCFVMLYAGFVGYFDRKFRKRRRRN